MKDLINFEIITIPENGIQYVLLKFNYGEAVIEEKHKISPYLKQEVDRLINQTLYNIRVLAAQSQ